ncbi:GNAT family N-acetyltransferase [Polynucleobacter paneuropaeus]|nr:GNAT family N-acetyltransferase [Polynucleobacter paneuropaeus]QWD30535.1 GNAT family N-acetyltransferase [Polynucleobacter paneuropaeus]
MTPNWHQVNSISTCRIAREQDIPEVAKVHLIAFPHFFLSTLGFKFLCVMYRAFMYSPKNIFIVAEKNGVIQGFATGLMSSSGSDFQVALRFYPQFIYALSTVFFSQPLVIFKRIIYRLKSNSFKFEVNKSQVILRSFGIRPEYRGSGIANDLIKEFEAQAVRRGIVSIALTTDARDNERAIAFYSKNGFKIAKKFYQNDTRAMYLMEKFLT